MTELSLPPSLREAVRKTLEAGNDAPMHAWYQRSHTFYAAMQDRQAQLRAQVEAADREAEWCVYHKGYEEGWQDAMRAYRAGSMRGMDPNATASPPGMPTSKPMNLSDAMRDFAPLARHDNDATK